jgi:hypothetical protein
MGDGEYKVITFASSDYKALGNQSVAVLGVGVVLANLVLPAKMTIPPELVKVAQTFLATSTSTSVSIVYDGMNHWTNQVTNKDISVPKDLGHSLYFIPDKKQKLTPEST